MRVRLMVRIVKAAGVLRIGSWSRVAAAITLQYRCNGRL